MADNALAWLIIAAMILIVAAGLAAGLLLSWAVSSNRGWSHAKRWVISSGLAALGIAGGVLVVIATFYESTWAPPPQVTFTPAEGFAQAWVILLEDPASDNRLVWHGVELPFYGKSTVVRVPANGIVRVQSLSGISGRMDITAQWSDGPRSTSQAGGPAPKSARAISFSAFNRVTATANDQPDPPFGEGDALGAFIAARERTPP